MAGPAKPQFIDRPEIGEVFADDIQSVSVGGGVVTLTFTVLRQREESPPALARVLAGRTVLTLPTAIELHRRLGGVLAALQTRAQAGPASTSPEGTNKAGTSRGDAHQSGGVANVKPEAG
jgi:hypothetical protein